MRNLTFCILIPTQTTEILSQFPTKAAKEPAKTTEAEEIPLF